MFVHVGVAVGLVVCVCVCSYIAHEATVYLLSVVHRGVCDKQIGVYTFSFALWYTNVSLECHFLINDIHL